jgi:hypothetical protein
MTSSQRSAQPARTLYIDGIDRINPDQKRIILDILNTIEANPGLSDWRVLATSRDQGLETYRAWFPATFYSGTQMVTFRSSRSTTPKLRPWRRKNLVFVTF